MALPAPGNQISMSQVRTELGGGTGSQSLAAAGVSLASITSGQPCALSADLGGTSAGEDIVVSFGSTSTPTYSSTYVKSFRLFNHDGHTSISTIRPYIQFQTSSVSSCTLTFQWYIGTAPLTGTWTTIATTSSAGFNSSYYIPTSGVLDYNETMYIQVIKSKSAYGFGSGTITITTTYAGTGTIDSYTRVSPYAWSY